MLNEQKDDAHATVVVRHMVLYISLYINCVALSFVTYPSHIDISIHSPVHAKQHVAETRHRDRGVVHVVMPTRNAV